MTSPAARDAVEQPAISNTWSPAVTMETARTRHTATQLLDGSVLVAGGDNASGLLATATLYQTGTDHDAVPQTTDDCKDGGWQTFRNATGTPRFLRQGDCVSFVARA